MRSTERARNASKILTFRRGARGSFRESQSESRRRYLLGYNSEEAEKYDGWVKSLDELDHEAFLADISVAVSLSAGMQVLDAGAGTGALTLSLRTYPKTGLAQKKRAFQELVTSNLLKPKEGPPWMGNGVLMIIECQMKCGS